MPDPLILDTNEKGTPIIIKDDERNCIVVWGPEGEGLGAALQVYGETNLTNGACDKPALRKFAKEVVKRYNNYNAIITALNLALTDEINKKDLKKFIKQLSRSNHQDHPAVLVSE